tara:strand:- start:361 stop:1065 length:705 start_codon:yes stop_codon:yes gene_type:complete
MLGLGSNIASIGSHCSVSSFSPEDVSNLQLWFKNNHGVTAAQWDDSSGNGHHAQQSTVGDQAAVSEGGLLFVESEGDHYDLANSGVVVSSQEAFIVFIVCEFNSATQNSILGTGDTNVFLEFQTSSKIRFRAGGNTESIQYDSGTFATGAKAVFAIQRESGSTGNINLFKNGSAETPVAQEANTGAITFNELASRASDRFFDGIIHELLCYDTADLTSDEITNINNYLKTKHGI